MAVKLVEHTYGTHIYMKMRLNNKKIEEQMCIFVMMENIMSQVQITEWSYTKEKNLKIENDCTRKLLILFINYIKKEENDEQN